MENARTQKMFLWAVAGLVFIINSLITSQLITDDGFVSSVSAAIAVAVLLIPMLGTIINDVKSGDMKMHELAVVAVVASCLQGDFATSAWIALFILLSMIIERRTATGAQTSLETLAKLSPGKAHRITADGSEEEVEGHELNPGDQIRIRPGDSILADGTIRQGRSSINEANITGESIPVDKAAGDPVFAGTANLSGALEVTVEKAGPDTTIGKVRELILNAQASRLPFVRFIDEYTKYYTPVVLLLAATVLFFTRNAPDAIDRVVALLVATCPIALILATPAAVVAALSAAARLGVLFKDVGDIEAMTRANAFVFDKTGTLTTGLLEVIRLAPCEGIESAHLLRQAACAEFASNHPIARAVQALAKRVNVAVEAATEVHEEPGRGVRVRHGDHEIVAGNMAWIEENGVKREAFTDIDDAEALGASLLFILEDGKALGWLAVSDKARGDAKESLQTLQSLGVSEVAMVSGDRSRVVEQVAEELAVERYLGECTPQDKVAYIDEAKEQGRFVVFVGDGVNDGPALAAAHIGVAMGAAGSDIALESATVALMNNELNRLPFLLRLARRMRNTVLQNFVVGGAIIFGGVILSASGTLSPTIAALLQVAGALFVAMNSARLIREGEELERQIASL